MNVKELAELLDVIGPLAEDIPVVIGEPGRDGAKSSFIKANFRLLNINGVITLVLNKDW